MAAPIVEPNTVVNPAPIKGAANPPVTPTRIPPPTVANPTNAKRLALVLRERRAASACSRLVLKTDIKKMKNKCITVKKVITIIHKYLLGLCW